MRCPSHPARATRLRLSAGSDPLLTLAPLWQGPGDPAMRVEGRTVARATRTVAGPATVRLHVEGSVVAAEAWGAGAEEVLGALPALLGEDDDPSQLRPHHPGLHRLARRFGGLRMTRGTPLIEVLLSAIIGQKVTAFEARRSYRQLIGRFGEPAPGPLRLMLPPSPALLANLRYYHLHRVGIERRRAETLLLAARAASSLQEAADRDPAEARRRLMALPGVGAWTVAETLRAALGDPDALSVGDYNLPGLVSWSLAGERIADDTRMLELLEPYRGQRARVVMLLELGGVYPPRRGPRLAARSIAAI